MSDIINSVFSSIFMASFFCFFMVFCMLSNTVLGVAISFKTNVFDWKVFLNGIIRNTFFIFGIIFLTAGVAGITQLFDYYKIVAQETTDFISVTGIILIVVSISYKIYVKQAIEKINSFTGLKSNSVVSTDPEETSSEEK